VLARSRDGERLVESDSYRGLIFGLERAVRTQLARLRCVCSGSDPISRDCCQRKEVRCGDYRDPLKCTKRQQMPAVSDDDMCCPNGRRAFKNLVVVWVSGEGLERTGDRNDLQKREKIRHRIKRLAW
jgi:hypothetical protein